VLEAFWKEHAEPADEAIWYRYETAGEYLSESSGRYRRPIVSYTFREPIDLFDRHLYNKGSCVLWTLRSRLGDEAFWAGVRLYLDRHGHGTVHTRHFQRALEEATGANLDGFFEQWVHSPGHPVLEVNLGREGDDGIVTVKQTQSGEGVPDVFDFRLRVGIVAADGSEKTIDLDVRERERTFVVPGPVSLVRVDPGYRVLADMKISGAEAWLCTLVLDADPVLALRAAKGLIAEGSHKGLEAVENALRTHPFHGVRGAIAGELAPLGTARVLQVLIVALGAEQDPRARRAIASALGRFRDPLAADALVALLKEELPTWQLHGAALLALGQTRDPRAIGVIREHLTIASWGDWVRQRALEALAETEDASVLDTLIAHTAKAFSDRTRAAAAGALGQLADAVESVRRAAVDRLVELVTEGGFRTQSSAIHALGHAGDHRAEPALSLVHDTAADGRNRRSAYEALVRIRKGRTTEQGLSSVRRRLDELAEENAKLRARVDRLAPLDTSRPT
jgi:aminopeptidase N